MALHVYRSGAWVPILDPSIRQAGAWAPVQAAWIYQGGAWVLAYVRMTPPTDLSAVDVSYCEDLSIPHAQLQVHWTSSDLTKQTRIYRDGVLVQTVAAGTETWVDTDVAEGGNHYIYEATTYDPSIGAESALSVSYEGVTASNICGI